MSNNKSSGNIPEVLLDQQAAPELCPIGQFSCQYLGELHQLRQEVDSLTEQVRTDALTGLYNFRYLNEILPMEMERTRRSGQPMSMILLDIDHFKQFNDKWGHDAGNLALVHVARMINITLRKLDVPCRFGGEEFVVVLPDTDLRQAARVAERVREIIASTPMAEMEQEVLLTVSLGVDEFRLQHVDTPEGLLRRVDTWLYKAKTSGRNRVAHPDFSADDLAVSPAEKDALFGLMQGD